MDEGRFQIYRAVAVAASFAVAVAAERLSPLDPERNGSWRNWRVNLELALTNTVIVALICGACAYAVAAAAAAHGWGLFPLLRLPPLLAVVASVLVLDFTAFAWHRANHRFPWLWRWHAVHHSDVVYDASTSVRFHAGEILISLVIRLGTVVALGLPVSGVLAFEAIYSFFNTFEHGNIKLPAGCSRALGRVLVTPALHRHHHAVRPTRLHANFGTILSVWDRLCGTLQAPQDGPFEVGLQQPVPYTFSLLGLLKHPFKDT